MKGKNVGIIASSKDRAEKKLFDIFCSLDNSIIKFCTHDKIILNDGSKIQALAIKEGIRGYKFHELYIDREIDFNDMYWNAILPCLRKMSFYDKDGNEYFEGNTEWDWRYHVRYF